MSSIKKSDYIVHVNDFPLSDEWKEFDSSSSIRGLSDTKENNATACLYKAKKGHVFDWHYHNSKEATIVLGEMILYVGEFVDFPNGETVIKILEKVTYLNGESYYLQAGVLHKCEFIEDTCLMLSWFPAFKDDKWQATWTTEKEKTIKEVNDVYKQLKERVAKSL